MVSGLQLSDWGENLIGLLEDFCDEGVFFNKRSYGNELLLTPFLVGKWTILVSYPVSSTPGPIQGVISPPTADTPVREGPQLTFDFQPPLFFRLGLNKINLYIVHLYTLWQFLNYPIQRAYRSRGCHIWSRRIRELSDQPLIWIWKIKNTTALWKWKEPFLPYWRTTGAPGIDANLVSKVEPSWGGPPQPQRHAD